jgi:hypothetical protein
MTIKQLPYEDQNLLPQAKIVLLGDSGVVRWHVDKIQTELYWLSCMY